MGDLCAALRLALVERFNDSELRTLAADLGIDYDELPGSAKADRARELVAWFERRRQLRRLVAGIEAARPDVDLPDGGIVGCQTVRIRRKVQSMEQGSVLERQVERLVDSVTAMREDVHQLRTDVRVLQADMATIKRQVGELEEYVRIGPPMSRQMTLTVVLGVALIMMAAAMVFVVAWR